MVLDEHFSVDGEHVLVVVVAAHLELHTAELDRVAHVLLLLALVCFEEELPAIELKSDFVASDTVQ